MLASEKIMGFVPTGDFGKSKVFYKEVLGLELLGEDPFGLQFRAGGSVIRVARVDGHQPRPFTILGWEVVDVEKKARELKGRGVSFERYPGMQQDELGIWDTPSGARVVWFKDPDGNVLSLTQC